MVTGLRSARRGVAACVAVILTVLLAACSGGGGGGSSASPAAAGASSSSPTAPSSVVPTRWWSNGAVQAGSTIDPKDPGAAAASLSPSRTQYCGMLKDTLTAGKSILPGITSSDPALLTSTEAFVDEIEKVAPAPVTSQWKTIGTAVVALVKAGGSTSALGSINIGAVTTAAEAISSDASSACGVNLSALTGGITLPSSSPS